MRAGIAQGLILAPEHAGGRTALPDDGSYVSATQAAELIGISRAAVYKALEAGTLRALRAGNVTVIERDSAEEYAPARDRKPRARSEHAKAPRQAARGTANRRRAAATKSSSKGAASGG